jgi:predicted MFS family arabinose efflux permease
VTVAQYLVRLLGERGFCTWGGTGPACLCRNGAGASAEVEFAANASGVSFYMLHNTLQTNGTQMAPEARGAGMALFALCLFLGQAVGVPIAAPIVDRWGAPPVFWAAAVFLPLLALWFAHAIRRRVSL